MRGESQIGVDLALRKEFQRVERGVAVAGAIEVGSGVETSCAAIKLNSMGFSTAETRLPFSSPT
jgi:hypothetical protein